MLKNERILKMKKKLSLLLAAALMLSALAGCGPKPASSSSSASTGSASGSTSDVSQPQGSQTPVNLMVLSGPTGVGAAYLIDGYAAGSAPADSPLCLNTTVVADNQEVTDALVNGTADIAAVATNVASALAAKTNGAIQVLAVNTLGVLYILEKGDTVHSMADLKGKTLYATGQGANPEYVLNYLLSQNKIDPVEVDIQWMTAQEVSAKMASSENAVCMLPVPASTALMMQDNGVRQALSLSEEWDKLEQGALTMGCVVARTDYIDKNPEIVDAFLDLYGDSISFMTDQNNISDAAAMVAKYGITPNDKIAAQAIPQCNLTFLTGDDMKAVLEEYYQVLFQANPAAIGGSMPYDSFYYGVG